MIKETIKDVVSGKCVRANELLGDIKDNANYYVVVVQVIIL